MMIQRFVIDCGCLVLADLWGEKVVSAQMVEPCGIHRERTLKKETHYLDDGMGGVTYHPDGTSTSHSKPCTRMRRFVTDWEVDK